MNKHRISAANARTFECHTQIIGFGIAGLGLALAADQQERLDEFLSRGVLFIDQRKRDQWHSLFYDIASNSKASDFLAGIRDTGLAEHVIHSASGQNIKAHKDELINLCDVSDFFSRLAVQLNDRMAGFTQSDIRYEQQVVELRLEDDGTVSSLGADRQVIARSRYAVMACGADEKPLLELRSLAVRLEAEFLCSESLLRQQEDEKLQQQIAAGQKIMVIGGAHSAFSVLDYLLRHYGSILQEGQIVLLVRSPVRLYHDSVENCQQFSPMADLSRTDASSGEVNRYSGLRGDARKVYLDIVAGREPRVNIVNREHFSPEQPGSVGSVIQATGYQARFPVVTDAGGNILELSRHHGNLSLTSDFNVQTSTGSTLIPLFALGLGCFNASDRHFIATGEVPVGVNIYQANDAHRIFQSISDHQVNTEVSPA